MVHGKSRLDYTFGRHHRALKDVEEEVKKLMIDFLKVAIESGQITQYIGLQYPEQHEYIINPPLWISTIKAINSDSDNGEWSTVGRKGHIEGYDPSVYAYWRSGQDLDFIDGLKNQSNETTPPAAQPATQAGHNMYSALTTESLSQEDVVSESEDDKSDDMDDEDMVEEKWLQTSFPQDLGTTQPPAAEAEDPLPAPVSPRAASPSPFRIGPSDLRDPADFFYAYGCDGVPVVPTSNRDLFELLQVGDIWSMSKVERLCLHAHWMDRVRADLHNDQLEEFERLRRNHAEKLKAYNEGKDEVSFLRRRVKAACST